MIKAFISQPMRGKTNKQIREERAELVEKLELDGYEVLDTVFDNAPKNTDEAVYYLAKSIEYLAKADTVVFMKGWEQARGCRIEHTVAYEYGKEIIYQNKEVRA